MRRALRPIVAADAATLLRWRNSPDVSRFMYTDHVISPEEHAAWFERVLTRSDASYWIITCDGEDVGLASLTEIDWHHLTCSWALYVGEVGARGKGMGPFTTYTLLNHVFGELELRKLSCEVLASNTTALAMYESFGFVREGRFREQILKPDGAVDVHRLGMLDREWLRAREAHRRRLLEAGVLGP